MGGKKWMVLGGLVGAAGLAFGLAGFVYSQRQRKPETLNQRLAREAKVKEETVASLLKALGPAVRDEIRRGNQVSLPGLGVFRVVRIPEHRDMRGGRPVMIPGVNYVEFIPVAEMTNAANAEGARPAVTVPQFEYNPLPNQTPSQYTPKTRVPSLRTP